MCENLKYNFLSIKKLAEEKNAELFIILVPSKPDIEIFFEKNRELPKLTQELSSYLIINNINFIDILTNLSIASDETDKLFLTCDSHPNELAHQLIANILNKKIYEKN